MPAYAVRPRLQRERRQSGLPGDKVLRQGGRAGTKTKVRFLKCDDVGTQRPDHVKNPCGIAAQVRAQTRADVPGRQTQGHL